MILKVAHNIRISMDANVSVATEMVVDNPEEAERMGAEAARYMNAYMRGFSEEDLDRDDED